MQTLHHAILSVIQIMAIAASLTFNLIAAEKQPLKDAEKWLGIWQTDPVLAKQYARDNNRPLLVVCNAFSCAHCKRLERQALDTQEFLDFAKKNQIVLYRTTDDDIDISDMIIRTYTTKCQWTYQGTPALLLFKVRKDINLIGGSRAFSPTQVEVPKVTWDTKGESTFCARPLKPTFSIFGVKIPYYDAWDTKMVIDILTKFFPNDSWKSMQNQDLGLVGFEQAEDFGKVANEANPSSAVKGWVKTFPQKHEISKNSPQKWYKFIGSPNRRYYFYLSKIDATNYPIQVIFYNSNEENKPISTGKKAFITKDINTLNSGFYFDTPQGEQKEKVYYLKLITDTKHKNSDDSATYQIYLHETVANPTVGTLTNPLWRHSEKTLNSLSQAPGQWSMDLRAEALAAAYAAGKPVLLYFTGTNWCPYCLRMEHTVILSKAGESFRTEIAKTYPVVLDNKMRDGSGPCLLTDWLPHGYLEQNQIDSTQASEHLLKNAEWERKFKLPGKDRVDYPTFIYCRVTYDKNTDTYDLEPVGRFSAETTDPNMAVATMRNLRKLYDAKHVENSQAPENSKNEIPAKGSGSLSFAFGGTANSLWFKFTANSENNKGKSWIFDVKPTADNQLPVGTEIHLAIYDSKVRIVEELSALTPETPHCLFVPESTDKETVYWLNISTPQLDEIANLQLLYEEKMVFTEMIPDKQTIYGTCEVPQITIPLHLNIHRDLQGQAVTFDYQVVDGTKTAALAQMTEIAQPLGTWTTLSWEDTTNATQLLKFDNPFTDGTWNGTKNLTINFRASQSGNCEIREKTAVQVKIVAEPAFLCDKMLTFTLYKNMPTTIELPICPLKNTEFRCDNMKQLTSRNLTLSLNEDKTKLILKGTPNETMTLTDFFITLQRPSQTTNLDRGYPHQIKVSIKIDGSMPTLAPRAFTGVFKHGQRAKQVVGQVNLERLNSGIKLSVLTMWNQSLIETIPNWTAYDAANKCFTIDHKFANGTVLKASIDEQGYGKAWFTNLEGLTLEAELFPVSSNIGEFKGKYNVALRNDGKELIQGLTEGWLSIVIDDAGKATITMKLYEYAETFTIETFIYDQYAITSNEDATSKKLSSGEIALFQPFNWQNTSYEGHFSTILSIMPLSVYEKTNDPSEPRVAACDNAWLKRPGMEEITLSPCGTLFDNTRRISEAIGEDTLFFITEQIDNLDAIAPNHIRLKEIARQPEADKAVTEVEKYGFQPLSDECYLARNLEHMTVNANGEFTLKCTLLIPQSNVTTEATKPLAPIDIKGIIVPTQKACCWDDKNVAIGYGFFKYPSEGGKIYRVCLFAGSKYTNLESLTLDVSLLNIQGDEGKEMPTLSCSAEDSIMLFRKKADSPDQQSEGTIVNLAKANNEVTLPDNSAWELIALSVTKCKKDSDPVVFNKLNLVPVKETTFSYTPNQEESQNNLQKGWNIIAIPVTHTLPEKAQFVTDRGTIHCFQYDETHRVLTRTETLKAGHAYWLYVNGAEKTSVRYKAINETSKTPALPSEWGLRAYPTNPADQQKVIAWKYQNGQFILISPLQQTDNGQPQEAGPKAQKTTQDGQASQGKTSIHSGQKPSNQPAPHEGVWLYTKEK